MSNCEIPEANATSEEIKRLLKDAKTIAVVGISNNEDKDSYRVAKFLLNKGYKIIPVNPKYTEVLGLKCYPDLKSVSEPIDIVDIFRKVEAIPSIVDEAIEVKAGAIWMQLGLVHNGAARKAKESGLLVVMNKCTKVEYSLISN